MSLARHPQVVRLRQQLEATPWLRWAFLAIGLLLAMLALGELETVRKSWQQDSVAEEAKLRRIKALQGQDVWLARAKEAAALHQGLLAQIPPASTPGAAQAALQGWLQGLANSTADPQKVRIAVEGSTPVESVPGVIRLRASLQGSLSPRQALNIARTIESGPSLVTIDALTVRSESNQNASISMSAFYRLPAAGAAPAEGGAP